MPSVLRQGQTKFVMRKDAERAALRSVLAAGKDGSFSTPREELERAKSIDEALSSLAWRLLRGGDENSIVGLRFEGREYQGNEEPLFEALAPYVEPGSIVELHVENDTPKRFKFTGHTLIEKRIKPPDVFVAYQDDDDLPPPSRVPVFTDVVRGAPEQRRAYAATQTFSPGEWIEHSKFGPGLVMKGAEPGKVRVLFKDGERVLLQGR